MPAAGKFVTLNQGTYRLVRRIGTGSSFGTVWLARQHRQSSCQEVALKFVNDRLLHDATPAEAARWRDVADGEKTFLEQMSPWDGRHIVRLLDSGEDRGMPVLALELMATDLSEVLAATKQAGKTIPVQLTLSWLQQVNHALARVHDRGWRYLDLKPANLLLDSTHKCLKLSDFGSNRSVAMRPEHSFVGTPGWQAPEQVIDTGTEHSSRHFSTDARADYFALGMLFYTLVTCGQALQFGSHCRQVLSERLSTRDPHVGAGVGASGPYALAPDEEKLFLNCFTASIQDTAPVDATWCAAPASWGHSKPAAAAQALGLLRSLLAWAPEGRPSHEGQIAREILYIRRALPNSTSTTEDRLPIATPAAPAMGRIFRLSVKASTVVKDIGPWLITALAALAIALLGLVPVQALAKSSTLAPAAIDLPRCQDSVTEIKTAAIRLGIVQPSSPGLLEHAALLANKHANLHLCAAAWNEVLSNHTPWTAAAGLERGVGWLIFALSLVITLVACAWFTPRSWWRGGPTLAGWGALAFGTVIASSVLLAAFNGSSWARGLVYAHVVSIQTGLGDPEWIEVSGAYELDRLLATKPLTLRQSPATSRASGTVCQQSTVEQPTRAKDDSCTGPKQGDLYRAHQALNLRSGPGVQFQTLRTLQIANVVRLTGASHGDWWQVQLDGSDAAITGWVSSLWLRHAGAHQQ